MDRVPAETGTRLRTGGKDAGLDGAGVGAGLVAEGATGAPPPRR